MAGRPRVLVGTSMHPQAMARLRDAADVDENLAFARDLPSTIARYDAMIVYSPRFDPALLDEARRLRVIACHACPPETLAAAARRNVRVTLVPSLWDTVADMALALMFAAARNVAGADAAIRRGEWGRTDLKVRYSGLDVFGKTLGIVGLGRIGAILARRVRGFDMRLLYYDAVHKPDLEAELDIAYRPFDDLLAESDIVSIQLPLTEATRGLIGERELRLMKRDAILVNTARGAILDEGALCRALRERRIVAAGLDVLTEEPLPPDNVVLAPHLGGSTKECDGTLVEDAPRVLGGESRCPRRSERRPPPGRGGPRAAMGRADLGLPSAQGSGWALCHRLVPLLFGVTTHGNMATRRWALQSVKPYPMRRLPRRGRHARWPKRYYPPR